MPEYIKTQMDLITKGLLNEELPDNLRMYPIRLADNLRIASDDKIQLNVIDYCKKISAQSQERVVKNNKDLEELSEIKKKINEDIDSLNKTNELETNFQRKMDSYVKRYSSST